MNKVAFFVDGHFMFKRVSLFKSFFLCGKTVRDYCARHLKKDEQFYRIFYYDTPPLERVAKTPFGVDIDFGATASANRKQQLLQSIRETPDMALRIGKTTWQNDWLLSEDKIKELTAGAEVSLVDGDFYPNIKQKTVDMKIGLDIATITFKKLANRVVLLAGDSDFSPAAKLARTEGMHVTLDPLGNKVPDDLLEHIDVMCTPLNPNNPKDIDPKRKHFFVACKKCL
jgi:uncharacterized LabA/DUF88 family protein